MINSAKKQSSFLLCGADGLLRGACHRARIRATRWLAMTVIEPGAPSCHRPRKRGSSIPETPAMKSRGCGVLDIPHARGMTTVCEVALVSTTGTGGYGSLSLGQRAEGAARIKLPQQHCVRAVHGLRA